MKKLVPIIILLHAAGFAIAQTKNVSENFLTNVGDTVIVTGKIYGGAFLTHVKTKPTFLNLGDTSPDHRLIIRIEPQDRDKFSAPPEIFFLNKIIQVKGRLQEYKGLPLIQVSEPEMIKTSDKLTDSNTIFHNNFTAIGVADEKNKDAKAENKEQVNVAQLQPVKPDTILQTAWIKNVTEKAAEEKKINLRIVQKTIDLRTAPFNDAPVIAQLHPGMVVSIVYTSKKWSYISIGSVDGFNNVNGFIKHKKFRHLKKAAAK